MRTLTWQDLNQIGKYGKHKAWHPDDIVSEYFCGYRRPSRAYPHSYARAAMTYKFSHWLYENKPDVAKLFNLSPFTEDTQ